MSEQAVGDGERWDWKPGQLLRYVDDEATDVWEYRGDGDRADVPLATCRYLNTLERRAALVTPLVEFAEHVAAWPRYSAGTLVDEACALIDAASKEE